MLIISEKSLKIRRSWVFKVLELLFVGSSHRKVYFARFPIYWFRLLAYLIISNRAFVADFLICRKAVGKVRKSAFLSDFSLRRVLWSNVFPLGFYINSHMREHVSSEWASKTCQEWSKAPSEVRNAQWI